MAVTPTEGTRSAACSSGSHQKTLGILSLLERGFSQTDRRNGGVSFSTARRGGQRKYFASLAEKQRNQQMALVLGIGPGLFAWIVITLAALLAWWLVGYTKKTVAWRLLLVVLMVLFNIFLWLSPKGSGLDQNGNVIETDSQFQYRFVIGVLLVFLSMPLAVVFLLVEWVFVPIRNSKPHDSFFHGQEAFTAFHATAPRASDGASTAAAAGDADAAELPESSDGASGTGLGRNPPHSD